MISISGPLAGFQVILLSGLAGLLVAVAAGAVSQWRGRR